MTIRRWTTRVALTSVAALLVAVPAASAHNGETHDASAPATTTTSAPVTPDPKGTEPPAKDVSPPGTDTGTPPGKDAPPGKGTDVSPPDQSGTKPPTTPPGDTCVTSKDDCVTVDGGGGNPSPTPTVDGGGGHAHSAAEGGGGPTAVAGAGAHPHKELPYTGSYTDWVVAFAVALLLGGGSFMYRAHWRTSIASRRAR